MILINNKDTPVYSGDQKGKILYLETRGESPSDVVKCSTLFTRCISEYFIDKLGDES